jgi:hypothetical protein
MPTVDKFNTGLCVEQRQRNVTFLVNFEFDITEFSFLKFLL